MKYNTDGQEFHCIAFNASGRVTGDEDNITCELKVDAGSVAALNDTNPTEIIIDGIPSGEYVFSLSQAETAGHQLSFRPVSATSGVQVIGTPGNVIYTTLEDGINALLDLLVVDATGPSTDSVRVTVDSTEQVSITCDRDVTALTLSAAVQEKGINAWTTVATVANDSISKSSSVCAFAMTSAMTSTPGTKRILVSNAEDSDVVASPLLFVSERL